MDNYYQSKRATFLEQCMERNMNKVVGLIKILQGSVVTETVLGGLTIYRSVPNLRLSTCAKK